MSLFVKNGNQSIKPVPVSKKETESTDEVETADFILMLRDRNICSSNGFADAGEYLLQIPSGMLGKYLELVDRRDGGGKMAHKQAIQTLTKNPVGVCL